MEETKASDKIDLFDFFYEIWRTRWVFLAVILICVSLAGGLAFLLPKAAPMAPSASFSFTTMPGTFLSRSNEYLLADLLSRVDKDGKLGLQFAGWIGEKPLEYQAITKSFDRTFGVNYIGSPNIGQFVLNVKDGNIEIYNQIYQEFLRAAESQFLDTKVIAIETLKAIDEFTSTSNFQRFEISNSIIETIAFIEAPAVKDNSLRFFNLRYLEISNAENKLKEIPSTSSVIKGIFIGGILGLILACMLVMFQISIKLHGQRERSTH